MSMSVSRPLAHQRSYLPEWGIWIWGPAVSKVFLVNILASLCQYKQKSQTEWRTKWRSESLSPARALKIFLLEARKPSSSQNFFSLQVLLWRELIFMSQWSCSTYCCMVSCPFRLCVCPCKSPFTNPTRTTLNRLDKVSISMCALLVYGTSTVCDIVKNGSASGQLTVSNWAKMSPQSWRLFYCIFLQGQLEKLKWLHASLGDTGAPSKISVSMMSSDLGVNVIRVRNRNHCNFHQHAEIQAGGQCTLHRFMKFPWRAYCQRHV